MSYLAQPSTSSAERIGEDTICGGSQWQRYALFPYYAYWPASKHRLSLPIDNSPHTSSIHILDDDSLLHVFQLYRPFLLGEDDSDDARLMGGVRPWVGEWWWHTIAHVCQRWRNLILGSASYFDLCIVCTYGTPVSDMLAHSPPLPLVIDYLDQHHVTAEDEERTILALNQRDRVRRIRLWMPVPNLQKLIVAIDGEYTNLEHLLIMHRADNSTVLKFPETLQTPHLRHLALIGFTLPIGSRLLATAVGLVTLSLFMDHPSTYFHPTTLLRWLSSLPHLETLVILFSFPVTNRNVEGQLTHTPITTLVALPNLRCFRFRGVSAYMEAIIRQITTPFPQKLEIEFFSQLTIAIPRLGQFMKATENLIFESVKIGFSKGGAYVDVYRRGEAGMNVLSITVYCRHLDWQVSSVAQISDSLGQMFSAVEHLTLEHGVHIWSSEEHDEADPTEWRKILNSFRNVKTLCISKGLIEELSRCLELDDGELSLEILPELQELTYFGSNTGDAFTSFVDARQDAGRPLTLVRRSPSPERSSVSFLQPSSITPASGEAGTVLDT